MGQQAHDELPADHPASRLKNGQLVLLSPPFASLPSIRAAQAQWPFWSVTSSPASAVKLSSQGVAA